MDEQLNKALLLSDHDVQNFMRFVREFAVMSLIPWMERCVAEWNENVGHFLFFFENEKMS
jgi:hypothetical protein